MPSSGAVNRLKLPLATAAAAPALRPWVEDLLGELPTERRATCLRCVKLPRVGEAPQPYHYAPEVRCCTYLPTLHNFLVGAALADDTPGFAAGRATVEARIDRGLEVSPMGLYADAAWLARYGDGERFGTDVSLRCPHYLTDRAESCGVWPYREAVCATWFCVFDRLPEGPTLWREGIMPFLAAVELAVARWCATAVGAGENDWGPWEGDVRGMFRATAQVARALRGADVLRIGGDALGAQHTRASELLRAYRALESSPA